MLQKNLIGLYLMKIWLQVIWTMDIMPFDLGVPVIIYTGWPIKNGTVDTVDFSGPCSNQQLYFFTLLDRASFPHYNNTKIIKFGRENFIL